MSEKNARLEQPWNFYRSKSFHHWPNHVGRIIIAAAKVHIVMEALKHVSVDFRAEEVWSHAASSSAMVALLISRKAPIRYGR